MSATPTSAWRRAPISMAVSTCLGIGHLPGGPGTYAAAIAAPLVWWLGLHGTWLAVALFAVACVAGSVAADRACDALGEPDSRKVVFDEVLGVWAATLPFAALSGVEVLLAFVLFRVFDIAKPGPIRWLDNSGVVADDLAAGALAAGVLLLGRVLL